MERSSGWIYLERGVWDVPAQHLRHRTTPQMRKTKLSVRWHCHLGNTVEGDRDCLWRALTATEVAHIYYCHFGFSGLNPVFLLP